MGAAIVLHGLFLLHCAVNKDVAPLKKGAEILKAQTCEILAQAAADHYYQVGDGTTFNDLPISKGLSVTLPTPSRANPDNNLSSRVLELDSSFVNVDSSVANVRIVVPIPDEIYGANRLLADPDSLLNGTDSSVILSQPGSDNRLTVAETVVLSYPKDPAFSLMNGAAKIQDSKAVGRIQVLALYAWPAKDEGNCYQPLPHPPMNNLLVVKATGKPPTIQLMHLSCQATLDDPGSAALFIPNAVLRPPCLEYINAAIANKRSRNAVHKKINPTRVNIFTATRTGCSVVVHMQNS